MTRRRWILLGLLVVAIGVAAAYFIWPGEGMEMLYPLYVVPVAVVNAWEWTAPGITDVIFGKG
jgi:hypothetical protein